MYNGESNGGAPHDSTRNTSGGGSSSMQKFSDAIWSRVLGAADGKDAPRQLLLGLGSSSRAFRELLTRLLTFKLITYSGRVLAIRTAFPKIASLGVLDADDVNGLDNIRSLLLGGSVTLTAPAAPLLCVTSLRLWKWRDDLEILRRMPMLEVLSIMGLERRACTSPIAELTRLRHLSVQCMDARDVLALENVGGLPLGCALEVMFLEQTRNYRSSGPWATVLRSLAHELLLHAFG